MKKILVIEYEAQTREIFLECLKAEGFYTIGAANGLVGVQQAQEQLPDLIISDIVMPQLDGHGVLTALRQNPVTATIPLIFVTASVSESERRQGMKLGADDYIVKPCTVEELLGAITTCLEKRSILRQWYTTRTQSDPESPTAETAILATSESIFPSVPHLSEVFDFIEANYHQSITVEEVAQAVGYSPTYLTNLTRKQTAHRSRNPRQEKYLLIKHDRLQLPGRLVYQP